jgi:serine phosphatase RsbU (regulator of sigma subunit)
MDISSGKFTHYYEKQGLPNPFIYSIIKDRRGHLWITSNKGVSEFDGRFFRNYDVYDGLQDYEFNTNAGFISSAGEIFLGGPSGVNRFNPTALAKNTFIPPVVFTNLKVMDKPLISGTEFSELKEITLNYDEDIIYFAFAALDFTNPSRNQFMYKMEGFNKEWIYAGTAREITYTNLDPGNYVMMVKGSNADGIWNDTPVSIKIKILPPFWRTYWFYALCIVTLIAAVFFYIRRRTRSLLKSKQELELKVEERTAEVQLQRNELAQKNKDITDSINYAQRIQNSIIPGEEVFIANFPDAFVYYKPRDIVSGDFYWYAEVNRSNGEKEALKIFAAIDCTGHGVPGAFMSLIANDLLNQTLKNRDVNSPGDVLQFLNQKLPATLNRKVTEIIRDGMDMAVCAYDPEKKLLYYSGANRPLWKTDKNGVLTEINPTKASVGGFTDAEQVFENHAVQLHEGDSIFLFTDGYTDQFGGMRNKKIGSRKFKELIAASSNLTKQKQKEFLINYLENWKGENSQVDDICVIGITV